MKHGAGRLAAIPPTKHPQRCAYLGCFFLHLQRANAHFLTRAVYMARSFGSGWEEAMRQ